MDVIPSPSFFCCKYNYSQSVLFNCAKNDDTIRDL